MALQIQVKSALLTHDTEMFTKMDPYVMVKVGNEQKRTKTHQQGGKKPKWNQFLTFNGIGATNIQFKVMDQDPLTDDKIGEALVPADKFKNNPTPHTEFISITYKGKPAGKIEVQIYWRGGGGQTTNINNLGYDNVKPNNTNGPNLFQTALEQQKNSGYFLNNNPNQNSGWSQNNNGNGLVNNASQNSSNWGNNGPNNSSNNGWGNNNTPNNSGWGNNNNGWGNNNNGWGNNNNTGW